MTNPSARIRMRKVQTARTALPDGALATIPAQGDAAASADDLCAAAGVIRCRPTR
jgi:hypothetical protein